MADPIRTMSSKAGPRRRLLAAGRERENEIRKLWARWGVMPYPSTGNSKATQPSA